MISIIIVDDSAQKVNSIKKIVLGNSEIAESSISTAPDIYTAKELLSKMSYDLMILDLSLPQRFGDTPESDGGISFLEEIRLDDQYKRPFHIIGLTAYENLKTQYQERFQSLLWYCIYFDEQYDLWRDQIDNHIKYLLKSKYELKFPSDQSYDYDIAIVTALLKPELEYFLKLDVDWKTLNLNNDHTNYYTGFFKNEKKQFRVVAASADQMGLTASAHLCQKMIIQFRPRYLVMGGIAAGLKDKSNLGDIVVSSLAWDYGSGKIVTKEDGSLQFKQDPRAIPLDPVLQSMAEAELLQNNIVQNIERLWSKGNGFSVDNKLKFIIGPMASGSYVIENIQKVQEVVDQQRKLSGIDMESYAVFFTATHATIPRPQPFVAKSVCDFADNNKDDKFQAYASFTSAQFLYNFILTYFKQ